MPDEEILFALLPPEGDWIGRDAASTALSERIEREIDTETFDRLIWLLGERVALDPHHRLLCRQIGGISRLPERIEAERDIEGWFEQFVWKNAARTFYDPAPRSLSIVVQNTARVGGQAGRWTRPDLCMACISRYHYAPMPSFDLFTFELKMPAGCNMLAVHEALSHTTAAHYAYLGLYLPTGSKEEAQLPAMLEQAQHHGVGVIRMDDPRDEASYRLLLTAERKSPTAAKVDGFIEDRFDETNRLALRKWIHR